MSNHDYLNISGASSPKRHRAMLMLLAAAFAIVLIITTRTLGTAGAAPSTPFGAGAAPERGIEDFQALNAKAGPPIRIGNGAQGDITVRPGATTGAADGYCVEADGSGALCTFVPGPPPSLRVVMSDGHPVPTAVWQVPPGISTVVATWSDGSVAKLEVVRPWGGNDLGFAAAVMPKADQPIVFEGLDSTGKSVTKGDHQPLRRSE